MARFIGERPGRGRETTPAVSESLVFQEADPRLPGLGVLCGRRRVPAEQCFVMSPHLQEGRGALVPTAFITVETGLVLGTQCGKASGRLR